jgi:hypothetical protein
MKSQCLRFVAAVALVASVPCADAFRIAKSDGLPTLGWPDGDIVMQLQLGDTGGATLIDGNTAWGTPAENALAIWNQVLGRAQFKIVRDSTIPRVFGDGKNSVYFDSTMPFGSFGTDVAAITVTMTAADGHITEADVIFNNQFPYNSYRGPLRTASSGDTLYDMRRVALREFGRVLGLDYPDRDSPQQHVSAQMNFVPSDLDTLAQDDVTGVQSLYGTPVSLARLANISTRLRVETGDNVLIGGLIVQGSAAKKVIARAIGPSLAAAGVTGPLADPKLELYNGNGVVIESNDNWQDTDSLNIEATGVAPSNSLESALIAILEPGNYTAIVRGTNGTSGVGLVEVYDLDTVSSTNIANISTRGHVATDDNVMIGGFIVQGASAQRVVMRGLGPSLTALGVAGALADPVLELHDATGSLIVTNDNWKDSQTTEITQTGIPPGNDLESAIVVTLNPGNYTVIVRGKSNTTGVALVEIYRLLQTTLPISIAIAPTSVAVVPGGTEVFGFGLDGTMNTGVVWSVNGIPGGNSVVGTISSTGVYQAPITPPPGPVYITARAAADPGVAAAAVVAVGNGILPPSIYEGTYIGQCNANYHYQYFDQGSQQIVRVDGNKSFNMTIELKTLVAGVSGVDTLIVTKVTCSDPFFGAQFGVVPDPLTSVAILPNPTENVSTQAGEGIVFNLPNGVSFGTANDVGDLHVSTDARLISNTLDPAITTTAWTAINVNNAQGMQDYLSFSVPDAAAHGSLVDVDQLTWALTRSAF